MEETTKRGLIKPDIDDDYDVTKFNQNADTIEQIADNLEKYSDDNLTEAKAYSDTKLTEAKSYSNTKLTEAKSYSNTKLTEAKSYSDTKLTEAKSYSDTKLTEAKTYSNTNLNTAKTYTDNQIPAKTGIDGVVASTGNLPTANASNLNKKYLVTANKSIYKCLQTSTSAYAWIKEFCAFKDESISIAVTKDATNYYNASTPTYNTWQRYSSTRPYIWVYRVKLANPHNTGNFNYVDYYFGSNRTGTAQATIQKQMYMLACVYWCQYIASDNSIVIMAMDPNTSDGWFENIIVCDIRVRLWE